MKQFLGAMKKSIFRVFGSWDFLFVAGTTLLMAVLYSVGLPFLEDVELKAWDLHFQYRGKVETSGPVAFVTIDEESVNREGRWPWPRRVMGGLLKAVDDHGALVIGLDMGFFEPDLNLRQKAILDLRDRFRADGDAGESGKTAARLEALAAEEDEDQVLAATIRQLDAPLVLGHFFYGKGSKFVPEAPPEDFFQKAAFPVVITKGNPREGRLRDWAGVETNIPLVREASKYSGSFNVVTDPDGSVRWMPLVLRYQGRFFPSLALQMLAAAFPEFPLSVKVDDSGIQDVRLGPVSIPTNDKGDLLVNFYGPGYSFPSYSATAVMRGEVPADCLKGRIVVVGNTTMGLYDMRPTSFDPVFPGVELHCTVMENIIQQEFMSRSDRVRTFYDLGALFGLAALFFIVQYFVHGIALGAITVAFLGGYVATTHYLFLGPGIWINHVYPVLSLGIGYFGVSMHRYLTEAREKRRTRQTFSLYVPQAVVEEMLAHPDRLRLGGEKKELSVMFSDIRGFTTISEKLPAEELVPLLNGYLTRMTEVVFEHQGTVDKYIGDAIMAIFGAPLPQEDHPARACATALDMMRNLRVLQEEWRSQGLPVLNIGIGINTGMMTVGNMGSERRFDYTVLGDNVNLASRLEGLTKVYGASIIVGESTWAAAKAHFVGRELDLVRVKGKLKPVAIYELLERRENEAAYEGPLGAYAEALRLFRERERARALDLFRKVEAAWPNDAPSILYQGRCADLLRENPGDAWSHVTVLDHK